jgi:enoyl-CoA hydratase/carnithine racemase
MELTDYQDAFKTAKLARDDDGVLTVTWHSRGKPMVWNALAHTEAPRLFGAIASDPANQIVVVTGTGNSFITTPSGYGDVYTSGKVTPADWHRGAPEAIRMLHGMLDIPVPVIAAVNGPVTGHSELPLLCDITICSQDTYFQDAAHLPNNLVPGDGVQILWPLVLGPGLGRYFLLTAMKIEADEAYRRGIVAEVVPKAEVLPRAYQLARQLLRIDPLVLRHTRQLFVRPLRRALDTELELGLAIEAQVSISRFPVFGRNAGERA